MQALNISGTINSLLNGNIKLINILCSIIIGNRVLLFWAFFILCLLILNPNVTVIKFLKIKQSNIII